MVYLLNLRHLKTEVMCTWITKLFLNCLNFYIFKWFFICHVIKGYCFLSHFQLAVGWLFKPQSHAVNLITTCLAKIAYEKQGSETWKLKAIELERCWVKLQRLRWLANPTGTLCIVRPHNVSGQRATHAILKIRAVLQKTVVKWWEDVK